MRTTAILSKRDPHIKPVHLLHSLTKTRLAFSGGGSCGRICFGRAYPIKNCVGTGRRTSVRCAVENLSHFSPLELNDQFCRFSLACAIESVTNFQAVLSVGTDFNFSCLLGGNAFFYNCVFYGLLPLLVAVVFAGLYFLLRQMCKGCVDCQPEHLLLSCCIGIMVTYVHVATNTFLLFRCREVGSSNCLLRIYRRSVTQLRVNALGVGGGSRDSLACSMSWVYPQRYSTFCTKVS